MLRGDTTLKHFTASEHWSTWQADEEQGAHDSSAESAERTKTSPPADRRD